MYDIEDGDGLGTAVRTLRGVFTPQENGNGQAWSLQLRPDSLLLLAGEPALARHSIF
jgi:hypothetical protein